MAKVHSGTDIEPANLEQALADFRVEFKRLMNGSYQSPDVEDDTREDRFRVSGFPYCGLRHARRRMNPDAVEVSAEMRDEYHVVEDGERKVSFGMKYYTTVGTHAHRYIQYVMGFGANMLGGWNCVTPDCKGVGRKITHDNICPKCGRAMDYEELNIKRYKHLSGHIDGVWRDRHGNYWIVDYKTSSVDAIRNNGKTGFLPYKSNVAQILGYCALLELEMDIKISGWILVYVARDKPTQTLLPIGKTVTAEQKSSILRKIARWDKQYGTVMSARSFDDIMTLIDDKPCASKEKYLKSAYHSGLAPCLLGSSGVCFKRKELIETMKLDWATKPEDWLERGRPAYLIEEDKD